MATKINKFENNNKKVAEKEEGVLSIPMKGIFCKDEDVKIVMIAITILTMKTIWNDGVMISLNPIFPLEG